MRVLIISISILYTDTSRTSNMDREIPLVLQTGPILMSTLFTYFLDGVFAMQLSHYYMTYGATDDWIFKVLVGLAALTEITHLCISTNLTYICLALNFGNPAALMVAPYSTAGVPFLNSVVGFCAHSFFAWRIMSLTKNRLGKLAAALVMATAMLTLGAGAAATIQYGLANGQTVAEVATAVKTSIVVWGTGSVACDILISIAMVSTLVTARGSTSFSSTKGLLDMLIVQTIETGIITSVCAVANEVTFLVLPPYNVTHFTLNAVLGRLYANVLLASLNGRERARSRLDAATDTLPELDLGSWRTTRSHQHSSPQIKVTRTVQAQGASKSSLAVSTSTGYDGPAHCEA